MQAHGMACVVCHVPQPDASSGLASTGGARWNQDESNTSFKMYVTQGGVTGTLDGPSALCLSCHDGVTAPDDYGGGQGGTLSVSGANALGRNLSNDHPIGIQYPPVDQFGARRPGYHERPRGTVFLSTVNGQSRVECTSCHDPHGALGSKMLRVSSTGSSLCFCCHDM